MIKAEAVLCEDNQTVLVYLYEGEEIVGTRSHRLPLIITEDAFEDMRAEWEQAHA